MDVIALHQAGFSNTVASLGTALTTQHAILLKRYTEQVILTYDSDGAGEKAALRAIPILKEVGISTKVLNMKPYKDPDEFIKNLGAEAFRQRIHEAQNSFLYEIDVLKKNYQLEDPEQKTRFYHEVAKKLLEFEEELERDNYIQAVAREYRIPYENLRRLVNRLGTMPGVASKAVNRQVESKREVERKKEKDDGNLRAQRLLLTWLIERPELYDRIQGILTAEDFVEPLYHRAAELVFAGYQQNKVNPAEILNHFINDEEQYREVAALFHARLEDSLNNEEQKKAFSDIVYRVKKNSLDHASQKATDISELQRIIQEQAALKMLSVAME